MCVVVVVVVAVLPVLEDRRGEREGGDKRRPASRSGYPRMSLTVHTLAVVLVLPIFCGCLVL